MSEHNAKNLKNLHFSIRYLYNTKRQNAHRITWRERIIECLPLIEGEDYQLKKRRNEKKNNKRYVKYVTCLLWCTYMLLREVVRGNKWPTGEKPSPECSSLDSISPFYTFPNNVSMQSVDLRHTTTAAFQHRHGKSQCIYLIFF